MRHLLGVLVALAVAGCASADDEACDAFTGRELRDALDAAEGGRVDADLLQSAQDEARRSAGAAEPGGDVSRSLGDLADAITDYRTVAVAQGGSNSEVRGRLQEAIAEVQSACAG